MALVKCSNCGGTISDKARKCPKCGYIFVDTTHVETSTVNETNEMNEIKKFNWGAFGLWPLWGFANGMWWLFIVHLALVFIPNVYVMKIIMSIYMGIKGGELAWKSKKWRNLEHFVNVQNSWNVWGIIVFVLELIITIFCFSLFFSEVGNIYGDY